MIPTIGVAVKVGNADGTNVGEAAAVGVVLADIPACELLLGRIGRSINAPMNSTETQAAANVTGSQRCIVRCRLGSIIVVISTSF